MSIISTPDLISNETSFVFQFRCNEDCFTECRLYQKGTQQGSFSPCDSRSRYTKRFSTGSLTTDAVYVFEVVATDIVDNQGVVKSFEWQTGTCSTNARHWGNCLYVNTQMRNEILSH